MTMPAVNTLNLQSIAQGALALPGVAARGASKITKGTAQGTGGVVGAALGVILVPLARTSREALNGLRIAQEPHPRMVSLITAVTAIVGGHFLIGSEDVDSYLFVIQCVVQLSLLISLNSSLPRSMIQNAIFLSIAAGLVPSKAIMGLFQGVLQGPGIGWRVGSQAMGALHDGVEFTLSTLFSTALWPLVKAAQGGVYVTTSTVSLMLKTLQLALQLSLAIVKVCVKSVRATCRLTAAAVGMTVAAAKELPALQIMMLLAFYLHLYTFESALDNMFNIPMIES